MPDVSYLAHHGTKGMKWGVWNDETRKRYLKLHTKTLPKGTELKRITNVKEAKNLDFSRSMYATKDEKSHAAYKLLSIPSIDGEKEAAILSMRLSKESRYADGETAVTLALEDSLGKSLSSFEESSLSKTMRNDSTASKDFSEDAHDFISSYIDKYGDAKIKTVLNSSFKDLNPERMKQARYVVWFAVNGSVGSFSNKFDQKAYRDKMKAYGFDVIADPEDYLDNFNEITKNIKDPLIVLNPNETVDKNVSSRIVSVREMEKEGAKTLKGRK